MQGMLSAKEVWLTFVRTFGNNAGADYPMANAKTGFGRLVPFADY